MLVAMTKVQIVGRKQHVEPVLGRLYRLGLLELVSAADDPALELAPFPGEDERAERGQRAAAAARPARRPARRSPAIWARTRRPPAPRRPTTSRRELTALMPLVEPLAARIEELRTELAVLPRYIEPLRRLLPLVPELAELDESEIEALQLEGGRARPQHDGRDGGRRLARGSTDRAWRSLRARLGAGRPRRDRVRDRDSAETRPARSKRFSAASASGPCPCRHATRISRSGARSRPWRAACARSRPSSTGRRSSCEHCSRRERRRGEPRAGGSSATSSSSKPSRRPGRRVARSSIVGWTPRDRVPELRLELERAAGGELALDELSDAVRSRAARVDAESKARPAVRVPRALSSTCHAAGRSTRPS